MPPRLKLVGRSYGRLTVIAFCEVRHGCARWKCKCRCGNTTVVYGNSLIRGATMSCGCYSKSFAKYFARTHGMSYSNIYKRWQSMIQRCTNKNDAAYKNYGGRGINICKRWLTFKHFFNDMGNSPKNMTLERVNNNKGYSPTNCQWANMKIQLNNTRRNIFIKFNNQRKTIAQWAAIFNLQVGTLRTRLNKLHWPIEKAFITPTLK